MERRNPWLLLVVMIGLLCARDAAAGLLCYRYEYAPNLVRAVQRLLKEQGLYNGPVDGKYGPKTSSAVALYQQRNDIRFTTSGLRHSNSGQLDEQTLKAMFGEEAPAGVKTIRNPYQAPDEYWSRECQ